jgi:tetratricopeptide (TPR) repeat protein
LGDALLKGGFHQ